MIDSQLSSSSSSGDTYIDNFCSKCQEHWPSVRKIVLLDWSEDTGFRLRLGDKSSKVAPQVGLSGHHGMSMKHENTVMVTDLDLKLLNLINASNGERGRAH